MVSKLSLVSIVLMVDTKTEAIWHSFLESRMVLDSRRNVRTSKGGVISSKTKS